MRLTVDAAALGLVATTMRGAAGSIVARHKPQRESTRATVLLHGAAGRWTTWTPVLDSISEPVLLDLPGFGDATLTPGASLGEVSALIVETLESLGYDDWHLVGHSMGGFLALHLAATTDRVASDRVVSVGVISATTWSVIESVEHPVRKFGTLPAFTMLLAVMRAMRTGAIVKFARRIGVLRLAVFPLFRHTFDVDDSVIAALATDVRPGAFAAAAEFVRGYPLESWSTIGCPVRAVQGDRDVFARDDDLARLKSVIAQAETRVIHDCGHFAAVEQPRAVIEALRLR